MMDRLLCIVAFAVLVAFVGVLLWHVPRYDLGGVALATLALAAWDFFGKRA